MPHATKETESSNERVSPSEEVRQVELRRQEILSRRQRFGTSASGVYQEVIVNEATYHRHELQNVAGVRGSPLRYSADEMRALRPRLQRSNGVDALAQNIENVENQPPASATQPGARQISRQQLRDDLNR